MKLFDDELDAVVSFDIAVVLDLPVESRQGSLALVSITEPIEPTFASLEAWQPFETSTLLRARGYAPGYDTTVAGGPPVQLDLGELPYAITRAASDELQQATYAFLSSLRPPAVDMSYVQANDPRVTENLEIVVDPIDGDEDRGVYLRGGALVFRGITRPNAISCSVDTDCVCVVGEDDFCPGPGAECSSGICVQ